MAMHNLKDLAHIEYLLVRATKINKIQEILSTFEKSGEDSTEMIEEWILRLSGSTMQEEVELILAEGNVERLLDSMDKNIIFYTFGQALTPLDVSSILTSSK